MSSSPNLPLRVLVKGASTVNWTSRMGGPRSDLTFPRVVEEQLLAQGRPCRVETITMTSERTATILGTWQREILGFSPDVIVLVYGHYETIHLFLPRWLERHANSLRARPRRIGALYRRVLLRPAWMLLARLQARLDRLLPATVRRRHRSVVADLDRYLSHVKQVGSPLVYCFELLPPASSKRDWFPGMTARIETMNQAIADLVARRADDNVRYFRVREIVDKHVDGDLDAATPDGFHYTPLLHREVGIALARDIEAWARTQPHLHRSEGLR